ncbi:MAG: ATP-binding cassette domain-containing protein [Bacteroidales bacterium]|jgi:ABC-2 type transport system ATP-binding protein|nr:ATP-binding cassette domain-containing protein [Bacteroidales bacterium]
MITINDLKFSYGRKVVFENISFKMELGKIYGLLGENGAGKTTLLRIIAGLLFPNEGSCTALGADPSKRWPSFLQEVFYLPEEFGAPHNTRVERFAKNTGCFYPSFNMDSFCEYAKVFDVDITSRFTELSFGQKKKAMLAFGIATNAKLMLFDEPTNGLDIPSKTQFRKLIAQAASNERTFIISTHQVRDLENLIDPIIILDYRDVLLNHSIKDISEKLCFGIREQVPDGALYSEPALNGVYTVEENADGKESRINMEHLFNAAMANKARFKKIFNL